MNSAPIISVQHLSKAYRIGRRSDHDRGLRHAMTAWLSNPFRQRQRDDIFWALKDVSFDVQEGEVIGIIGRNGAGKSTLLKIISRITLPTSGEVRLRGRVASLLEVGTGFHPELTGRENIFLNGSILGMTRLEVKRKLDEIVAFSEIDRFLDTPVKRYSSGMYVRLAFAVAAHLEPEILLVDEVLAVGDAGFQKKCLGKMGEVARGGRTVLFVSHNMHAVAALCARALLLSQGRIQRFDKDVAGAIRDHLFADVELSGSKWDNRQGLHANPWFQPLEFFVGDAEGRPLAMPARNDIEKWVYVTGMIREFDPALTIGYALYSDEGACLYWTCQTDTPESNWPALAPGRVTLRGALPSNWLNEGNYRLELLGGLYYREWLFQPGRETPSVSLIIRGGLSQSPQWMLKRPGICAPILRWERHGSD